jgi:hypothetical protein
LWQSSRQNEEIDKNTQLLATKKHSRATKCASCVSKLDQTTLRERRKMFKYKRPESLSFPQIYYKFNAKDKNSDNIVEYRVQDLPEEYFEQTVDFMVKYFIPDETLCMSLGISRKAAPIKEFSDFWMCALKEKLSIACFKNDGSEEFVGANVLLVSSKDDIDEENVSQVS